MEAAIADNVVPLKQADKFEEFWSVYPKKAGKALAHAKWDAIVGPTGHRTRTLDRDSGMWVHLTLSATPGEIIEGAKRYRDSQIDRQTYKLKEDGKYTCHPATWLNQGRWMD